MIRQSQDVGSEGLGVQAGGDVNVQYGPNALQMAEIISAISTQMAVFYADGQVKVEQRLQQFKEDVFKEFAKEKISNPGAFSDPDFQACVGEAQKGYIRANDETVSASLINLLAERSRFSERGRPSLILNSAINVVGNLTAEEINSITLIFFIKKTHRITGDPSEVLDYYVDFVSPLLNSLTSNSYSNEYLSRLSPSRTFDSLIFI